MKRLISLLFFLFSIILITRSVLIGFQGKQLAEFFLSLFVVFVHCFDVDQHSLTTTTASTLYPVENTSYAGTFIQC